MRDLFWRLHRVTTASLNVRWCDACHGDQLYRDSVCLVCKTGAEPQPPLTLDD